MSVSTLGSKSAQPVAQTQNSELIYHLEDHPPFPQALFTACQHLLAMFVAVITPALLIYQALGLPIQDTQHIISMSLFTSGVVSIIQIKAWSPVGSELLSVQDISFNFVAPLIIGDIVLKTGGADVPTMMTALFGALMLTSCTEMVISHVLHLTRRIITPLVSGVAAMIIGLSLIQAGLTSISGGYATIDDNTSDAPRNLLLAGVVLALVVLFNRQRNPYLRVASLVIAMAAGCALAWFMGMLPKSNEPMIQELIMVPTPLYYGLGIEWSLLLPLMLVLIITSLETIGDIAATPNVSERPVSGPLYMKCPKDGVLANGLNSFVPVVFNTFSNSCLRQSNGVIQLTGVAGRYVGFVVMLMLIVLDLFLAVNGFVQHIPEPVLDGATLIIFSTIATPGMCIVSREPLNCRAILIIALSLAVGLSVSQQPLILQFAPEWLKNLLSSGVAAGGITTIVLNLIFPPEKQ